MTSTAAPFVRRITEVSYWPDGCDPDGFDSSVFQIVVSWRGKDRYAVLKRGSSDCQLSRAGNWKWCPLPMQRRQYRHTFDEACSWAERLVNDLTVNGWTWAE